MLGSVPKVADMNISFSLIAVGAVENVAGFGVGGVVSAAKTQGAYMQIITANERTVFITLPTESSSSRLHATC